MLRACVRAWGQVLIPLKLMEALQHNDGPEVTSLFEAGIVTFRSVRMRKKMRRLPFPSVQFCLVLCPGPVLADDLFAHETQKKQ